MATSVIYNDLFDLQGRGIFGRYTFRVDLPVPTGAGKDFLFDLIHFSHPGAQDSTSTVPWPYAGSMRN